MAYTSLYRKYRPDSFEKVIGQDHIIRTIKNQIIADSVSHAYIFTGTRGTGKTSVAKILAKAVNCLKSNNGSPCGVCENCVGLSTPSNFDIIEMDAASNSSVDQIRELTDKVNFPPTIGRFKVYIIDEVHMLSKSAFNALLKTLEEPPEHAIFILATTEIHQIPATILSRCLRFDFRLVSAQKLANHLSKIFSEINVKCDLQAVQLIANAGNGSVRDALSIADMCVSYCQSNITYGDVLEVLGASDPKKIQQLAIEIADSNLDKALEIVANMSDLGKSMSILASDLAVFFRNLIYVKNCINAKQLLALPDELNSQMQEISKKYTNQKCLEIMMLMNGIEGEFRYSSQHRILLESSICIACSDKTSIENDLSAKVMLIEKKLAQMVKTGFKSPPARNDARQVWKGVASTLEEKKYQFLAFACLEAEPRIENEKFVVKIPSKSMPLFTDKNNRDMLNSIFKELCDLPLILEEIKKIDDDMAIPFLKTMFGNSLEIK